MGNKCSLACCTLESTDLEDQMSRNNQQCSQSEISVQKVLPTKGSYEDLQSQYYIESGKVLG